MSITRRLIRLAAPIIGLNVLNVLALAVDTAMCGRLPNSGVALTALGFATQVIFLLMVAMMGLTVGTVAFVSRAFGADDFDRVEHVITQAVMMTVLLGAGVAVLGNVFAGDILTLLGASEAANAAALRYLRPLLTATTFNYLLLLFAAILRGVGNTRLPFLVSIGSNLLNVVLNYGLILGNWGLPSLGLFGAAIGTVAAQAYGALALMWAVHRGEIDGVGLRVVEPIDRELLGDLVRVGTPAAIDMVILNAAFLSIVGMLGRIEEAAVAAHGIGLRIQALAFVPGMSISQATGAMVGQALGADNIGEARTVVRASVWLCTGIMTVLAVLILVFVDPIILLFDVEPASVIGQFSSDWIALLGYGMPIVGVYIAFVGLLQGAGFTNMSLRINFFATVLFQIPASWVLGFPLGLGAWGVWVAFPISFVVKAILGWLAYRDEEWARTGIDV
jgi:putative MATE family efflux protein